MSTFTLLGHEFESTIGPSSPDPGKRRKYQEQGIPHLTVNDMRQWLCVDGVWRIVLNGLDLLYLKLATTEEELFDYINNISYDPKTV